MIKKRQRSNKVKEDKVDASHIKKVSKVATAEDLFLLTSHFKKEDNKKLHALLKQESAIRKKSDKDKDIIKILKTSKSPEDINESIAVVLAEEIENKYQELKDKGSELRKKGKDTLVAELKLMSVQYKLKLFRATKDKKDYLKIKNTLYQVEKDLI